MYNRILAVAKTPVTAGSFLACALLLASSLPVHAARPSSSSLLPQDTVAFVRIADTRDFFQKMKESSVGRMMEDEEVKPLLQHLYGSAVSAMSQVEETLGMTLDELMSIPQGEVTFAIVAPRRQDPAVVLMLEVGDEPQLSDQLLEKATDFFKQEGADHRVETFKDTDINIYDFGPNEDMQFFVQIKHEDTIIITSSIEVGRQLLVTWYGEEEEDTQTLEDNDQFVTISSRCRSGEDQQPEFMWFVDPIKTMRAFGRGNVGMTTALALLPALGLDGIDGVGGSMVLSDDDFDMISHLHLALDNPRDGIIDMIAFRGEDCSPEDWVPKDVQSYMSMNWDVEQTHTALTEIYDGFRGEGALSKAIKENISDNIEIDFEKDILPAIDGRVTIISRIERPISLRSQSNLLAVRLQSPAAFVDTLKKLVERFDEYIEESSFGGQRFYEVVSTRRDLDNRNDTPREDEDDDRQRNRRLRGSQPLPAIGILDDYLIMADRRSFYEQVIIARNDASNSLAKELDFKLVASKIRRQKGGAEPSMVTFSRPEEGMRMLYDLLTSDDLRQGLANRREENEFFRSVDEALTEHPLPEFEVIAKYLAPAGGLLIDDETGIHYTGFSLRRDTEPKKTVSSK